MRNFHYPGRSEVYSSNSMAATSQPLASETALSIMKQGGNAMDAAISAEPARPFTHCCSRACSIFRDPYLLQ